MASTPLPQPAHPSLPRPSLSGGVLARLARRKLALFGVVIIVLAIVSLVVRRPIAGALA